MKSRKSMFQKRLDRQMKSEGACMKAHGLGYSHQWITRTIEVEREDRGRGPDKYLQTIYRTVSIVCGNCGKVEVIP